MNGTEIAAQSQCQSVDLSGVLGFVSKLFSTANDPSFRRSDRDFTRGGPMSPGFLTSLLLYMIADGNRRGYQLFLDGFWDEARSYSIDLPTAEPISGPSFCSARRKIPSSLLQHLLLMTSEEYQSKFGHTSRWRGRRVFAVDGVKYNLQRHPDLDAAFGRPTNGICPQVLSSTLYDVCAKMPVDLRVSSCGSNERDHLDAMLHHLKPGDLIVLDRGYPSFELIRKLKSMGVDFLIRLTSAWNVATQMFAGDEEDCAVALDPPKRSPNGWEPIAARAIKLTNHDGEESVYLSSLSESEISTECIRELYHMRWEEEEFYKMTKSNYIGQGQFRARNPSGIVQEIHALELFLAVSRYLMAVAADVEGKPIDEVGQKGAVLAVADYVVRVFLQSDENAATEDLIALIKRITRHRYRKRPGRSFVRRSFKPNPRWTPRGHRRG